MTVDPVTMDIDEQLARIEAHEAALKQQPAHDHDDHPSAALIQDLNNVFAKVEQQQRLDKGRATLEIKSYSTE
jgi:hypothetical protein